MYMVWHGDSDDMLFDDPKFFDTASEAVVYAEKVVDAGGVMAGHALTVYRCDVQRVFEAPATK